MQAKRDIAIDIAKGLGIVLVVLGHTVAVWGGKHETLHRFIYSFHMPLFFAVSGVFISTNRSFTNFIKIKFTRFVIPFFFWVFFYFFVYMGMRVLKAVAKNFMNVNNPGTIIDPEAIQNLFLVPFLGNWQTIYKAGTFIDLWFLPAIFCIVVLYWITDKFTGTKKKLTPFFTTLALSFLVVWLNNKYGFHKTIPWSIDVAIVCLPFLFFLQARPYFNRLHWITVPFLIAAIYLLSNSVVIEVAGLRIENYLRFFGASICGIVLVFLTSEKIKKYKIGYILSLIGKRTYLIFVLQGLSFALFKPVFCRMPILCNSELCCSLALFLVTLVFGYALYPLFSRNNYLRLLALGIRNKN